MFIRNDGRVTGSVAYHRLPDQSEEAVQEQRERSVGKITKPKQAATPPLSAEITAVGAGGGGESVTTADTAVRSDPAAASAESEPAKSTPAKSAPAKSAATTSKEKTA